MPPKKATNNKHKPKPPRKPKAVKQKNKPKSRVRSGGGMTRGQAGVFSVRRKELWKTTGVKDTLHSLYFSPGASSLPRLDQYGSMFELWKVKNLKVHFISGVGSTSPGILHMGVDFDARTVISRYTDVPVLQPSMTTPIRINKSMAIPTSRVNRTTWMYCGKGETTSLKSEQVGFVLFFGNSGTDEAGEIWIEYEVDFSSPVPLGTSDPTPPVPPPSQININYPADMLHAFKMSCESLDPNNLSYFGSQPISTGFGAVGYNRSLFGGADDITFHSYSATKRDNIISASRIIVIANLMPSTIYTLTWLEKVHVTDLPIKEAIFRGTGLSVQRVEGDHDYKSPLPLYEGPTTDNYEHPGHGQHFITSFGIRSNSAGVASFRLGNTFFGYEGSTSEAARIYISDCYSIASYGAMRDVDYPPSQVDDLCEEMSSIDLCSY